MSSLTIGEALVARRQQLGLDKGRAADQIGMSRTTYGAYEANRQRPSVNVFPALAEFLDVDMEFFLELYGATMILAARPALQLILATSAEGSNDSATAPDEPTPSLIASGSNETDEPGNSGGSRAPDQTLSPKNPSVPEQTAKRKKDAKRKKKQKKKG